jgi:hypothetical protein
MTAMAATPASAPRPGDVLAVRGAQPEGRNKGSGAAQDEGFPDLMQLLSGEVAPDAAMPGAQDQPAAVTPRIAGSVIQAIELFRPGAGEGGPVAELSVELLETLSASVPPLTDESTGAGAAPSPTSGLANALAMLQAVGLPVQARSDEQVAERLALPSAQAEVLPTAPTLPVDGAGADGVTPSVSGAPPMPDVPAIPDERASLFARLTGAAPAAQPAESGAAVAAAAAWSVTRRETHFAPLPDGLQDGRARVEGAATLADLPETAVRVLDGAAKAPPIDVQTGGGEPAVETIQALVAKASSATHAEIETAGQTTTPMQQVFQKVLAELPAPSSPAPSSTPATMGPVWREPFGGQPLRSLDIALEPAGLGTVTVKLSVRDDVIRVELDTSRSEAAQLLERDRDSLTSLMKSAGYQVEHLTVRHTGGDAAIQLLQQALDVQPTGRDGSAGLFGGDASGGGRFAQGQRHSGEPGVAPGERSPTRPTGPGGSSVTTSSVAGTSGTLYI